MLEKVGCYSHTLWHRLLSTVSEVLLCNHNISELSSSIVEANNTAQLKDMEI
jgi:hypothetical protein